MALGPVNSTIGGSTAGQSSGTNAATDAFGLSFESLLKIVLTQLTYQDPLKPMDNFQLVSQLAQFSQIQQTQTMSDNISTLVSAQSSSQAAGLLGKVVEVAVGSSTISGSVVAITFAEGGPALTIKLPNDQTISDVNLGSVLQIREED